MTGEQEAAYRFLTLRPAEYGRMLGYGKLTALHNGWIREMLLGRGDMTLQAHRGSYKTTAVGVTLAIQLMLRGRENCMFIRKTDDDVKEVLRQVARNLEHPVSRALYRTLSGRALKVRANATEITTSAYRGVSGAAQLIGIGTQSSITGKHADRVFTDDIVNLQDRRSRAERERVREFYHELRNVVNRGGRIVNTGTPWHREDAFACMPEAERWDCYQTGLMGREEIEALRMGMPPSLFAANYELKHIASEDALFVEAPAFTDDPALLRDGVAHIDAAYGGGDFTALTCGRRRGDRLYLYGRLWPGHVDAALGEALEACGRLMCAPVYCTASGKTSTPRSPPTCGSGGRGSCGFGGPIGRISTRSWIIPGMPSTTTPRIPPRACVGISMERGSDGLELGIGNWELGIGVTGERPLSQPGG